MLFAIPLEAELRRRPAQRFYEIGTEAPQADQLKCGISTGIISAPPDCYANVRGNRRRGVADGKGARVKVYRYQFGERLADPGAGQSQNDVAAALVSQ